MGGSNSVPEENRGIYIEIAKNTVDLTTDEHTYKLDLKEKTFELTITNTVSTRKEGGGGGTFNIKAMSLLLGNVEVEGDKSKGEDVFLNFKTEKASSQTGGGNFGVPLPDPDHIVDFKMKLVDKTLTFVTFPKMKFDELKGELKKR
jgi:hypothetical protein